jgi:epoxyqueuosine reductase
MNQQNEITLEVKNLAISLGFSACGFSKVTTLENETEHLLRWIRNNSNASMGFMENNIEKRNNPELLVNNAKSIISVILNYNNNEISDISGFKVSKYAHGTDYHYVIKNKLKIISDYLSQKTGSENIRTFVDSAPVFEKKWAQNSGLGWIGKNTCLINKKRGSFFFIGEIISDIIFNYDTAEIDRCGSCSKCIESCPTKALTSPYQLDARRCISYLTIENKGYLPDELKNKFDNYIFGCDICQNVCPWNRFSKTTEDPDFLNSVFNINDKPLDFNNISSPDFKKLFKNSVFSRAGYKKIKRNIDFIIN